MRLAPLLLLSLLLNLSAEAANPEPRWWKGNLHTHSIWSDGDDYPEMITRWYKEQGYHFLAISDHNLLADHERWIPVEKNAGGETAFNKYLEQFGRKLL
ncbi:MAG: histidinol-phosphatase, partial [Verrucomicrobiaceae bacterium]